jgi:ribosome-binding factor A
MSRRTEKIGSAIRQEVSQVIMRELNDPRLDGLLPTVNRVKVAEDLSTADIYMVFMGSEGKQTAGLAALRSAAGMLRTRVAKALSTRTVPALRFHADEAYRREMEVLELLRKVEQERVAEQQEATGPPAGEGESSADPASEQETRRTGL